MTTRWVGQIFFSITFPLCLSIANSAFCMEPGIYDRSNSDKLKELESARAGEVQVLCYGLNQFGVALQSPSPHLEPMTEKQFKTFVSNQKQKNHISVWISLKGPTSYRSIAFPPDHVDKMKKIYQSEREFLLALGYKRTFVYGVSLSRSDSYMVLEDLLRVAK